MDDMTCVSQEDIRSASATFAQDRANAIARNAVSSKGIRAVARVPEAVAQNAMGFDIDVKQGERTNQKRSGRCWMFASLNTMRMRVINKLNLKSFELSQSYPLFFDKLEKSNWFLESIIDTTDEELSGRLVAFLLQDPVNDGGQWDMFRALVKKYGVVPKDAMPETACSSDTIELDSYLTRYLRGAAKQLRDAASKGAQAEDLRALKKEMLQNIYNMLVVCLGEPPASFEVRLRDKDDELVLSGSYTPQRFFTEVVDMDVDNYVSVISAPTADKPFDHLYTVARLGNVVEAGGVRYLNVEIERLKELAIAQLKDGLPVWFGCDVGQSFLRDEGILDTASLDVDSLFGFPVEGCMDRAARLDYGESLMTHAMVFEGVRLDEQEKPTLWKVENSWGKNHGKQGFDIMSDAWFDEYMYQIVIDKKYLSAKEQAIIEADDPIVLAPWDPMGSLACCV